VRLRSVGFRWFSKTRGRARRRKVCARFGASDAKFLERARLAQGSASSRASAKAGSKDPETSSVICCCFGVPPQGTARFPYPSAQNNPFPFFLVLRFQTPCQWFSSSFSGAPVLAFQAVPSGLQFEALSRRHPPAVHNEQRRIPLNCKPPCLGGDVLLLGPVRAGSVPARWSQSGLGFAQRGLVPTSRRRHSDLQHARVVAALAAILRAALQVVSVQFCFVLESQNLAQGWRKVGARSAQGKVIFLGGGGFRVYNCCLYLL